MMKKWAKPALLVIFVSFAAIAASYAEGIMQHLLVIATMIVVLRVIGGKDKEQPKQGFPKISLQDKSIPAEM